MIDFNRAIELIRRNGGFQPNSSDSSYYRTYKMLDSKPIQVRVSNHGTHLWTWYDRDYDPSSAVNICVVFSEDGNYVSNTKVDMRIKDNTGNVVSERKPFEVIQYVYNCKLLDGSDAALINQSVQSIWQKKAFKDPLVGTPKHAKVMRLKPNESIEIITENKTYNTMNRYNIKKRINEDSLLESKIRRITQDVINEMKNVTRRILASN